MGGLLFTSITKRIRPDYQRPSRRIQSSPRLPRRAFRPVRAQLIAQAVQPTSTIGRLTISRSRPRLREIDEHDADEDRRVPCPGTPGIDSGRCRSG